MIEVVTWRDSLEEARVEAREQGKELLIDLFNPRIIWLPGIWRLTHIRPRELRGCINEYTVPVRFNVKQDPGAWLRYHGFWTPIWVLQDVEGGEYRRSVGPLNAEQFTAELALGYGLRWLNIGRFERSAEGVRESARIHRALADKARREPLLSCSGEVRGDRGRECALRDVGRASGQVPRHRVGPQEPAASGGVAPANVSAAGTLDSASPIGTGSAPFPQHSR